MSSKWGHCFHGDVVDAATLLLGRLAGEEGAPGEGDARRSAGKRLAPAMAEVVEALEPAGELSLEPAVKARLKRMSAATNDRALSPDRRRLKLLGRSGTNPGSILRRHIAIRPSPSGTRAPGGSAKQP